MSESLILQKNPRYKNINSSMIVNIKNDKSKKDGFFSRLYNKFF